MIHLTALSSLKTSKLFPLPRTKQNESESKVTFSWILLSSCRFNCTFVSNSSLSCLLFSLQKFHITVCFQSSNVLIPHYITVVNSEIHETNDKKRTWNGPISPSTWRSPQPPILECFAMSPLPSVGALSAILLVHFWRIIHVCAQNYLLSFPFPFSFNSPFFLFPYFFVFSKKSILLRIVRSPLFWVLSQLSGRFLKQLLSSAGDMYRKPL